MFTFLATSFLIPEDVGVFYQLEIHPGKFTIFGHRLLKTV